MFNAHSMLLADFYKISHRSQYSKDTEQIYSTWTARGSRLEGIDSTVVFGFQYFIKKYLIDYFNRHFFKASLKQVTSEYKRFVTNTLGEENPDTSHIEALHNLGYLPLEIQAVPEGTILPIRVPALTIRNTKPEFFWLTNFVETLLSCEVWMPTTSATIAHNYRKILDYWAAATCDNNDHVDFQGHDFSLRGMASFDAGLSSAAGHMLSFIGTDTAPAIQWLEYYYNADITKELVGTSIPATEHSVQCCNGRDEYSSIKRLITEVYPNGFVSIVSDTWNLWDVLTKTIPSLKEEILNRDGRVVIRPDSGVPEDIICGKREYFLPCTDERGGLINQNGDWCKSSSDYTYSPYEVEESKGVVELLWDTFGGTINSKGYKVLDPHIGCIYGDAITRERATEICRRLEQKGFASSNIVFGIGSFTYQYNTRDTFGFALKSTYAVKGGKETFLYKDPITDNGLKKSQKGLVAVISSSEGITYKDELTQQELDLIPDNLLRPIFKDGALLVDDSLQAIRERLVQETKTATKRNREFSKAI